MYRCAVPIAVALAVCLTGISGCGGGEGGVGPGADRPSAIRHAATDGIDHFFFLRPIAPDPTPTGVFDGSRLDDLRVDVYLMSEDATAQPEGLPVAQFRSTGGASESENIRLDPGGEAYIAGLHTDRVDLIDGRIYRIFVHRDSDDAEYGYADVQLFTNMSEAKSLTDGTVFALKDGRTLPIKFRVEVGAEPVPPQPELLAFTIDRNGVAELYTMRPNGTGLVRLTDDGATKEMVDWSPGGSKIAFAYRPASAGGVSEVGVVNADGTGLRNLTNHSAWDHEPAWSPDGTEIAFTSDRSGTDEIYVMDADTGASVRRLTHGDYRSREPDWSPDGSRIVFRATPSTSSYGDICIMDARTGDLITCVSGPRPDFHPAWSPSGQEIAYVTSVFNIHVTGVDGSYVQQLTHYVHPLSAHHPYWSPDGSRIAFRLQTRYDPPSSAWWDICIINRDGSGFTQLTDNQAWTSGPAWWGP
jgi:Tol biopolymer transport system component